MLISLKVNDNKAKLFVDFLKNPDSVKINRSEVDGSRIIGLLKKRFTKYAKNPSATVIGP
ncbi:hypothetical protein CNR22_06805 [Sphingobacteriaceae bacterium]|nr:hypothetical protein CNR22_06805 [Sphingobacteriaceae bacterium]